MDIAESSMLHNVGHVLDNFGGECWQGVRGGIVISEDISRPVSGVGDLVQFSGFVVNAAVSECQGGLRCECPSILKVYVTVHDSISKDVSVDGITEFSRQAEEMGFDLRIHACDTASAQDDGSVLRLAIGDMPFSSRVWGCYIDETRRCCTSCCACFCLLIMKVRQIAATQRSQGR